jgi:hypothetical protein
LERRKRDEEERERERQRLAEEMAEARFVPMKRRVDVDFSLVFVPGYEASYPGKNFCIWL